MRYRFRHIFSGIMQLVLEQGLHIASQAILWKVRTSLFKRWMHLQDRLGMFTYSDWIKFFEHPIPPPSTEVKLEPPRFTVLVFAGTQGDSRLEVTVASMLAQIYPSWEARLVKLNTDEVPTNKWISGADQRLVPALLSGQPSVETWISNLQQVRGSYVIALNAGDRLAPHALQNFAGVLDSDPHLDVIYSDEDYLGEDSRSRHSPYFKPSWSPALMLSINYILYGTFQRELLLDAAVRTDPSEPLEYADLIYQAITAPIQVRHIPQVLVHLSTKGDFLQGTTIRQQARVRDYLRWRGLQGAQVWRGKHGTLQAAWDVGEPLVSIIIPTQDHLTYLHRCLDSIWTHTAYKNYEVILVDSGSQEPATLEYYAELRQQHDIHFIDFSGMFNFSAALNQGSLNSHGEILLFLNNDTEALQPDWLEELVRWASLPEVGIVGAKLLYSDSTIQHAGIVLGLEGHASHIFAGARETLSGPFGSPSWYRNCSAVTGACMAMRRSVYDELGGFDEGYQLVFSDIEICLRAIRAGYQVVYTPHASLLHHEGRTRYRYMPLQDIRLGYKHFEEIVRRGDPFYNPNLSQAVRIPTLRRPGEEEPIQRLNNILRYYFE